MKAWISLLLLLVFFPPICQAAPPELPQKRMGTLSGRVVTEAGEPVQGGGVVSFFNTNKGIPPMIGKMHRIPDLIGRMEPDGAFKVKLPPGSYYLGALLITDPRRGPGPPQPGETFYFASDGKGGLREFTIGPQEEKDGGEVVGALPGNFQVTVSLITIEGRLVKEDGRPFAGGVVLAKTDMNSVRPDFVSERTREDGRFRLQLPPDTPYYLVARERAAGRPVRGTYIGTYGSTTPISAGGALPVGKLHPAQLADGMTQPKDAALGPGAGLPPTVAGKAGTTISGIDIMMFKLPVPGEQRERLKGTLGLGRPAKQGEIGAKKETEPAPDIKTD